MLARLPYREIWAVDFEFVAADGERPVPVCMVARELRSGRLLRLWRDELQALRRPPFDVGADTLFVAYYASAELGCFLALGWPMPARILDLFAEFRAATNGLPTPCGAGLLGALQWHGLEAMAADEKTAMRDLVLRGGPWSAAERLAILDYCQADVDALAALLPRMLPGILGRQGDAATALGQALLRGRYMAAAARMEWTGVPIDTAMLARLRAGWGGIKTQLIAEVDARYGVYEGTHLQGRPVRRLPRRRRTSPGRACPPARWRSTTTRSATRPRRGRRCSPCASCATPWASCGWRTWPSGSDGRNRCLLSPFRARTGRNQPSNTQVHLRPGDLAALADPAGARHGAGLRRLQLAGDGHRRRAVGRPGACSRPTAPATCT